MFLSKVGKGFYMPIRCLFSLSFVMVFTVFSSVVVAGPEPEPAPAETSTVMSCITRLTNLLPDRIKRLPRQIRGDSPFSGDVQPTRIPLFGHGRPTLPFPHPWNYKEPLKILETYFWKADKETGSGRHNRYLEVPGFGPVFITRDPEVIRAILLSTGDKPGQFDRDQLPSMGIARSTGPDTLLFSNGTQWRDHRKQAAPPFGLTSLFKPEVFHEFEATFRETLKQRIVELKNKFEQSGQTKLTIALETEIKPIMLQMLVNNFLGANVPYEQIRNKYVPALERIIDNIVSDTVVSRIGVGSTRPGSKEDNATYDELTDIVLQARKENTGLWKQFKSEASDDAIRANLKVILAGALEATSSWGGWALSHLARNPTMQEKIYGEVKDFSEFTPDNVDKAKYLRNTLDETLRLTPSLYFLPRKTNTDTTIQTKDGRTMTIEKGTHILLDIWDTNRHEDHWGVAATGFPAKEFHPERWPEMEKRGISPKDKMHYGFGLGPRICPGKHLGQLEVSLLVGAIVKTFKFKAINEENKPRAGVSTKPADGTLVELELRNP
jgi:cytochrome P450